MRQGIDTVEISRIEKLLSDLDEEGLRRFFSEYELSEAGNGKGRAQRLAARFAAKEACCKLFPKEICLGKIEPVDFTVERSGYGDPKVIPSEVARAVMNHHRVGDIQLSMTHTDTSATAIASAVPAPILVPWYGRLAYRIIPLRRSVVMHNLKLVFGKTLTPDQIEHMAQAFYAHHLKSIGEVMKLPFLTEKQKSQLVEVRGGENLTSALEEGNGVLLLTGHFGNWELSTVVGLKQFSEFFGRFHFIRRPLKPKWVNKWVMGRFRKAGFGTLEKEGSLDEILDLLEQNHIVVSIFDQYTILKYGVVSEFFGRAARTFKSLAMLSQCTNAVVVPASSWREPNGTHVVQFEPRIEVVKKGRSRDNVLTNTRRFNEALERIILRHPEQWIWLHKRWKNEGGDLTADRKRATRDSSAA